MEFGPDDLVMIVRHYLPSLIASILISLALLGMVFFGKRRNPKFNNWPLVAVCVSVAPLAFWFVHFASTSKPTYTLTLLNSESSDTAERIYDSRFKAEVCTLDAAVNLAVSRYEAPNVRFYASCLIADMLITNSDSTVAAILKKVDGAPIIETEFFDGNRLTQKFYTPGHVQAKLSVRDIVEQRLQELRK